MNDNTFALLGLNTLQFLELGFGPLWRAQWTAVEQHPGPWVLTAALGGSPHTTRYLYPEHLQLLLSRFRHANPDGVRFGLRVVLEEEYAKHLGLTPKLLGELYGDTDLFKGLTGNDEYLGYPHLKPYLPEIYEPETILAMEGDPWLDDALLKKAIGDGYVPNSRERHPRWSPEWRAYCEALKGKFPPGWKNCPG